MKNTKKGFSIFIAIIVAGILTLIAFSISALSSRQISLANLNKESGQAIFAANAGIECALYWDNKVTPSAFATSTSGSPINCAGQSLASGTAIVGTTTQTVIGGVSTSVFGFSLNSALNQSNACAVVTVTKQSNGITHIYAHGYNTCDISNPKRVERGIEVQY